MSPVFQDCERASKCTLAPRGTWLSKPVRSRCFCTVDFASEGLNTNCRHLFVRKPLPRGLMPGHNRGCPNRQSIGADAWHVLSQRNPANGVVRLYLSFPGEEFHIKRSWQAFHFRPDRHEILMTRPCCCCMMRRGSNTMAVYLMVSPRLREPKLVRDRTVPSPEMFPALRGCERASKCIPAPRGMWLPNPSGPVASASPTI